MKAPRQIRRWAYVLVLTLLVGFAILGVRQVQLTAEEVRERQQNDTQELLATLVGAWERDVTDTLTNALQDVAASDAPPLALENKLRLRTRSWIDAVYVWQPATGGGAELLWPPEPVAEDISTLRADPCMVKAISTEKSATNPAAVFVPCVMRPLPVALLAASDSLDLLLAAHQPKAALEVLSLLQLPQRPSLARPGNTAVHLFDVIPLTEAYSYKVNTRRLLVLHLQGVNALEQLDEGVQASRNLGLLSQEVQLLGAPTLQTVLDLYQFPILNDLRKKYGLLNEIEEELEMDRLHRRIEAWEAIRDQTWRVQDAPTIAQGPRLLMDPVGDPPYLVFYARAEVGDLLVGIQVDLPSLIQRARELAHDQAPGVGRYLTIRDAQGRRLAGAEADPVIVQASSLIPTLRFGFTAPALRGHLATTWPMVIQLAPVALGLMIGVLALISLIETDRQQEELMERQREFMTRVTHELKTPLAGIRLMAENIEMGAFKGEEGRKKFANRIILEAERLGARLDEVIRAAARPILEAPQDTDIPALIQALAARWRPLIEERGGTLTVECSVTGSGRVLQEQLRDALTNLLDNALKYRSEERPLQLTLRASGDARTLTFEVEDNGIGVPAAQRTAIFERFRRVEGDGRGKAGGHGLGLHFVAESARAHHGRVECKESATGGARFIMRVRRRI